VSAVLSGPGSDHLPGLHGQDLSPEVPSSGRPSSLAGQRLRL